MVYRKLDPECHFNSSITAIERQSINGYDTISMSNGFSLLQIINTKPKDENFNQRYDLTFSSCQKWNHPKEIRIQIAVHATVCDLFLTNQMWDCFFVRLKRIDPCQGCGAINLKSVYSI